MMLICLSVPLTSQLAIFDGKTTQTKPMTLDIRQFKSILSFSFCSKHNQLGCMPLLQALFMIPSLKSSECRAGQVWLTLYLLFSRKAQEEGQQQVSELSEKFNSKVSTACWD